MPILIVEKGNEKGRKLDLKPGTRFIFGRDAECTLATSDHQCSRQHFAIEERKGAWVVVDLGSSNGTFVNDERITERTLAPGDAIVAGETQLLYHQDEASAGRGLAGKMVGGYKILERLGRGGMGTVYKANQVSLNRIVALKVLSHRVSADPSFVKRFQAEAQAAGRLNHPNIVQVYDVGNDAGVHYYSMEYIENGSVQTLATKVGALDLDLAIAIITDAARGLLYAEKKNLVHRDIKPDNLMVNSEGVVKIADLGLARDAGERARHSGERSEGNGEDSDIFGTPHFISPEQAQGRPVDTRSDIYSLGATAYRLLAGQTPFSGENVQEIIQKQIEDEPEPLRKHRKDCPAQLAAIVERMMRKDPAERYQNAQDLLNELEALEKRSAGGPSRLLLVAAAVVVLGGGGFAAWRFLGKHPEPVPAGPPPAETRSSTRASSGPEDANDLSTEAEKQAARAAFAAASDAEDQAVAARNPDWAALRERYQAVATKYATTTPGRMARDRVKTLDKKIADLAAKAAADAAAAESRAAAARGTIEKARQGAETAVGQDRFGDAFATVMTARRDLGPGADTQQLDVILDSLGKQAATRAAALVEESRSLEANGKVEQAIEKLTGASAAFVGENTEAVRKKVDGHAALLRDTAKAMRTRYDELLRTQLVADRQLAFDARKAAGELMQRSFDPAQAKESLANAAANLKRDEQKPLVQDDLAAVDAAARVRDQWVQHLAAQPPKNVKLKLPTPADKKKVAEFTLVSANPTGITAKRGATETQFPFSGFSTAELYELLFKEWVEKTEAVQADAVQMLLIGGAADRAVELAQELKDPAQRDKVLAVARHEMEAASLLAEVRDLTQRVATDETLAGRLLRKVLRLLDEYQDTRVTLVNRRAPPAPPAPASRPTSAPVLR